MFVNFFETKEEEHPSTPFGKCVPEMPIEGVVLPSSTRKKCETLPFLIKMTL
jgi:hypothetical protein